MAHLSISAGWVMQNFLIELPYVVSCNDERLLLYIENDHLKRLASRIPYNVLDELSSVGIAFKGTDVWYAKNHRLTARDREDVVCRNFYALFKKLWKLEYGIPCLRFSGNLRPFSNYFVNHTIFIHFLLDESSINEQNTLWRNVLSFSSKCTFIADLKSKGVPHFNIFTTDHRVAMMYLTNLEAGDVQSSSNFERYDLAKILRDWEPDEDLREELYNKADETISDFIYIKKLDLYVPGFLFFTSINIRRYRRAFEILTNKYNPRFVMTLPFQHKDRMYSVVFPICSKI